MLVLELGEAASGAVARWSACVGLESGVPCEVSTADAAWILGAVVAASAVILGIRYALRLAVTLRAVSPTPAVSRRLARWLGARPYDEEAFFAADGAGQEWVEKRRKGFERLVDALRERTPRAHEWSESVRDGFSDLRFADANRVPPAFAPVMRERFDLASTVVRSDGPHLEDLDGNRNLDVSGSYGVNLCGYDRYKRFLERATERVQDVGPVLGPLHPVVAENLELLKRISGKQEVSFHTSGTEAVMAAARLVRFNTRRKLIVTFSGAYHGWWDGVQPGVGNERIMGDCLPLKEMDPAALSVIRRRGSEIAGVLVNPVQSFHPNMPPPNDAVLMTSEVRRTEDSQDAYGHWLHQLRRACDEAGVPLIFDEVYSGFRLAPGGAQEHYGVEADLVLYGKTVAGGLPIGVVCGSKELMRRFDPARPMRIAYVIGTFSAHPLVMACMNEFLRWVVTDEARALYAQADRRCAEWVQATNSQLTAEKLPVRLMRLGTIWTVLFEAPGRYNWLLQYYLRAQGVSLSWVGTGRCLASLDFEPEDYDELRRALVHAAREMKQDAWWLSEEQQPGRDRKLRWGLAKELLGMLVGVPRPIRAFYRDIMQKKDDDHHASHNDLKNQWLHLASSSAFIWCYAAVFFNMTAAMFVGLSALFFRQMGHAVFEPPAHDKEKLLLGFTTRSKTFVVMGYLSIPLALWLTGPHGAPLAQLVAKSWFLWTLTVVLGRVVFLVWKHGLRNSMLWFVKLVTDPLTDIVTYAPHKLLRG